MDFSIVHSVRQRIEPDFTVATVMPFSRLLLTGGLSDSSGGATVRPTAATPLNRRKSRRVGLNDLLLTRRRIIENGTAEIIGQPADIPIVFLTDVFLKLLIRPPRDIPRGGPCLCVCARIVDRRFK